MRLKKYQIAAVRKLVTRSSELLNTGGNKRLVFQAPTGSGKTIIMAEYLSSILKEPSLSEKEFCVIWTAPRKLHTQSKDKLQTYYLENQEFACKEFFELSNLFIDQNEILFLNWESINKVESNLIIKENEDDFYLNQIIENTKDQGRIIILIIDESHHGATTEISKQLINDMTPDLTIEVSATPILENPDEIVKVSIDEVKLEGMIKKSISLNEDFTNFMRDEHVISDLAKGQDQFVLEKAIEKRKKLAKIYKDLDSPVNPLVLIQLPDRKSNSEEKLKESILQVLRNEFDVSIENGKLAIYLSEQKENLENIAKNDNGVEVLIFKQAIALGWDCPRAQILVLFRENKSLSFSIQTMGRIMRMPEPDVGHYANENLNSAYVFTNLGDISIDQDLGSGYITIHTSRRQKRYKEINLKSVYRLRQRERTRLDARFVPLFLKEAAEMGLKSKIEVENQSVHKDFIVDFIAESVDSLNEQHIIGGLDIAVNNADDLQELFDFFIRKNLEPFFPEERSIGRLKESIYEFFSESFNLDYSSEQSRIVNIVLSGGNRQHFTDVIDKAKESYKILIAEREKELAVVENWNVPESLSFTGDEILVNTDKSIMEPFYTDNKYKTEQAFIRYLDMSSKVIWWFKNSDRDATFFAIPYTENGEKKPFYVDFIVQLSDGNIGLYDTKRGGTVTLAKEKSDGLQLYVTSNVNCVGGIVDNTKKDFDGRWMKYTKRGDDLVADNFQNWDLLDLS